LLKVTAVEKVRRKSKNLVVNNYQGRLSQEELDRKLDYKRDLLIF